MTFITINKFFRRSRTVLVSFRFGFRIWSSLLELCYAVSTLLGRLIKTHKYFKMYLSAFDVLSTSTDAPTTILWSQSFADNQNILLTVVSSLSIFGSLTIIFTYFVFQDLQSTTRRFLVYISFGDFFTVFPYIITAWLERGSDWPHSTNCIAQSFVSTTAVMWSFFWTSSLAVYLYLVIVKKDQEMANKSMPFFHVINWGVPLALVGAAYSMHMLGGESSKDSGGWCWITLDFGRTKARRWMLACGKLCEILSYFIDVILCFIVARKISAEVNTKHRDLLSASAQTAIRGKRKLVWAPCLFVLLRMWGTIRFLLFCFRHEEGDYLIYKILIICHIIGDSSQGFVYFILFCVCTPKFRENVYGVLGKKKKSSEAEYKGRRLKKEERKYLLENPKNIVFYT